MKKTTLLMSLLMSMAIVACGEKGAQEGSTEPVQMNETAQVTENAPVGEATQADETNQMQAKESMQEASTTSMMHFKSEDGKALSLETTDGFETGTLKLDSGETYLLKREVSASGVRLVGENGLEIHFNDHEGVLVVNGQTVVLSVEK